MKHIILLLSAGMFFFADVALSAEKVNLFWKTKADIVSLLGAPDSAEENSCWDVKTADWLYKRDDGREIFVFFVRFDDFRVMNWSEHRFDERALCRKVPVEKETSNLGRTPAKTFYDALEKIGDQMLKGLEESFYLEKRKYNEHKDKFPKQEMIACPKCREGWNRDLQYDPKTCPLCKGEQWYWGELN